MPRALSQEARLFFPLEEWFRLSREEQNKKIEELARERRLFATLKHYLQGIPLRVGDWDLLHLWEGYLALHRFAQRLDPITFRPLVRVYLENIRSYLESPPPPVEVEEWNSALEELKLSPEEFQSPSRRFGTLAQRIIEWGGPVDWERGMVLLKEIHKAGNLLTQEEVRFFLHNILHILLLSKRNRKPWQIWNEVFPRTIFQPSDLYYFENRLRHAILEKNLEHAFRMIGVLIRAGRTNTEIVGAILKSSYNLDFLNEDDNLCIFVGAGAFLEWSSYLPPEWFYRGISKWIWDLAYEKKKPHRWIYYDEISVLKSREVIFDFRRAMLKSEFAPSWGYAEYAFVYGYDALKVWEEVVRLSPSYYQGGKDLMRAWGYLNVLESIFPILHDEVGIYLMAVVVRVFSRSPKDPSLLDPFPDEVEE